MCTQLPGPLHSFFPRAGRDDGRAEMHRHLNCRLSHATSRAPHQHGLARLEPRPRGEHPPCGQRRHRKRRTFGPAPPRGRRRHIRCRQHHQLGRGAGAMLAQYRDPVAQRLVAPEARGTLAAEGAGIEDHFIARTDRRDICTYRLHHPRAIGTNYVRIAGWNPGKSACNEHVKPVERRGLHRNPHISRKRKRRSRHVSQHRLGSFASPLEHQGAHQNDGVATSSPGLRGISSGVCPGSTR